MILKVKAGALQLTIFIVVVIASLLSGFLLLVHTQQHFKLAHKETLHTVQFNNKAIDYALTNSTIPFNDSVLISLANDKRAIVSLDRDYWGVFEKIKSSCELNGKRFQKVALIGGKQKQTNRPSLYVANHNKPLILVGKTFIKGATYLPEQGVRPGNISGKSYYNSQLIYGDVIRNQQKLPEFETTLTAHLDDIMHQYKNLDNDNYVPLTNNIKNSFLNQPLVHYSSGAIDLKYTNLKGYIVIQSDKKIRVFPSAKLEDVVLIAPEIEILNNVKGSLQAIAEKKIIVGEEVQLDYPSALVVSEKKGKKEDDQASFTRQEVEYQLKINKGSVVEGLIIYQGKYDPNNYEAQIYIEDEAVIKGELYGTNNVELKGKVYGTVYAANFVAHQYSSIYQNHLYNAVIDISRLPQKYVGLELGNNAKRGIVRWLY